MKSGKLGSVRMSVVAALVALTLTVGAQPRAAADIRAHLMPPGLIKTIAVPSSLRLGGSIATGYDGSIWCDGVRIGSARSSGDEVIARVSPDGRLTSVALHRPTYVPQLLVAGHDGAMWFVEHDAHQCDQADA